MLPPCLIHAPAVKPPCRNRSTPPAVASQRKQYAALQDRAPPSRSNPRSSSSAQESLFEFQAVGHELLILPNKTVAPSPSPEIPPSPPTAVESTDDIGHVGVTAQGEKAKARDLLAAIRTLKAIEEAQRPATPDEHRRWPLFPASAGSPCRYFPILSPADTKTSHGGSSAKNSGPCCPPRSMTARSAPPSPPSIPRPSSSAPCTALSAWRSRARDRPGARLRHRQFHRPGPRCHALYRRRAGPAFRAHRPRAPSRSGHPHRKLPRHPPAREPHRRRDRQRALRRHPPRIRRRSASPCTISFWRNPWTP